MNTEKDIDEKCSTCGETYSEPISFRAKFCSNGFHCCRSCSWKEGIRISICKDCQDECT